MSFQCALSTMVSTAIQSQIASVFRRTDPAGLSQHPDALDGDARPLALALSGLTATGCDGGAVAVIAGGVFTIGGALAYLRHQSQKRDAEAYELVQNDKFAEAWDTGSPKAGEYIKDRINTLLTDFRRLHAGEIPETAPINNPNLSRSLRLALEASQLIGYRKAIPEIVDLSVCRTVVSHAVRRSKEGLDFVPIRSLQEMKDGGKYVLVRINDENPRWELRFGDPGHKMMFEEGSQVETLVGAGHIWIDRDEGYILITGDSRSYPTGRILLRFEGGDWVKFAETVGLEEVKRVLQEHVFPDLDLPIRMG